MSRARAAQASVLGHMALHDAREFVSAQKWSREGVICPCCRAYVKVKRYTVTAKQARELSRLARAGDPQHWRDWLESSSRMQCTLRYAGLIYQPTDDPEKPFNRSGVWALTPNGYRWLRGSSTIPRFVYVLFGELIGTSPERMTFAQALRNRASPEEAANAELSNDIIQEEP